MAMLNISLPDPLKEWVEAQALAGRHGDAGDYVRDLIRKDRDRAAAVTALQALVTEGLESGVSGRSEDDIRRLSRDMAASRQA